MKLFWKIFFSLFISFVVIVSSISYIISVKQISDMEKGVIEDQQIIASFLSKEIEVGYFESRWPFESLKKLSERKGFLFWWIVKDDGTIHLADNPSFMETYAHDYFPEIAHRLEKEHIYLNRNQNYDIFSTTLETRPKKWSFWFGFSLNQVAERRKEIIFLITAISVATLVTLGAILYFAMKHFTKPIQELSVGAAAIGKGDLTYRVRIKSQDELGQLSNSFNKMADNLKGSQNYLLTEIAERKRSEDALQKSEKAAKRLAQENAAMAEIGRIISSTLNIEEVYERFAEETHKFIPFDGIAVNIINHKEGTVTVPYVSGIAVPGCQPGDVLSLGSSVTGEVARTRSGLIIQTEDKNELQARFPTLLTAFETGLRSVIAVPLISKDQVFGAIHFRSTKPNAYSDQDLKVSESIATQIAGAIANAQLFIECARAEKAVGESEKRYRQLIENATEIIYTTDNNGKFSFANISALKIAGYSFDEFTRFNCLDLVVPEYRERLIEAYAKMFREKQTTTYVEFPFLTKSGEAVWLGQNISILMENEKVAGFHNIGRDITERKRAEEALRESEEGYRSLVESAKDAIFTLSTTGTITSLNPAFEKITGWSPTEWIGKPFSSILHPDDLRIATELFQRALQGEMLPMFELRVLFKSSEYGFGEFTATPQIQKGKVKSILGIARDITDRKQAEEALRNSEERFRIAAESSGDLIWDWDISNGRLEWFGNIDERLGYNPGEFPRTIDAWEKIIHPHEHNRVMIALDQHLKMHKPYVEEYRVQRKDGTFCYWTDRGIAIWDEKGNPHKMIGACTDITERKRAEEVLRESEERYRTILENIEDGYYEVDLPGNFTFFNDSLCRMLGYPRDEMIGMGNQQYTDPENRKKLFQAFNEVYRTGKPVKGFDWEVVRKDGRKVFGEVSVSLIKDSNGQPIGFRGIARDITERKEAEEALQESEKKFRVLTETAASGIFIHQGEKFVYVNPASEAMTGYSREELLTMDFWDLVHPEFRELVKQRAQARQQGKSVPSRYELKIITKNGEERWVDLAVGMINFQGKPAILGTDFDITERKRAEEEMKALEEQLRQSQKIEAIGRLAGGIAHDFNNVLTVIKGYSQLSLLDLKESDPLWGNIQEIQKATQRATDLTRHLLAFSRRQILDLKVLDLNSLLKDLDKMLRRIIGEDIELSTLLANDLGRVKIDPGQIEQVILNLAVNARDAMPSGGKLLIETSSVELDGEYTNNHVGVIPGHYVRLSVSDTGVGMSKDVKEKIFEPFFTTKEKGKGTGLGLSTVYGIVKQSGGIIWVYSEPGHGTTFKIYLPRVEEALDAVNGRDGTDSLPGGSETVLLVEDEPLVRDLARRLLSQQGYTILEAADGGEALRIAQEYAGKKIHLLLTDVVMPRMGGKELAEQIKPLRPDIKVLYTSGYTDDAIVHHGVLDPGTHFLQKPFSLKTLSRKVREVLDR